MKRIQKNDYTSAELQSVLSREGEWVEGKVDTIFYRGNGGWMSGLLILDGQTEKFCGTFAEPDAVGFGTEVRLFGCEVYDSNYGCQIMSPSMTRIEVRKDTRRSLVHYLSSDLFPEISRSVAKELVKEYGTDVLAKIVEEPEIVQKTCQLTDAQIHCLKRSVSFSSGLLDIRRAFPHMTDKDMQVTYLLYGALSVQTIQQDPYRMLEYHNHLQAKLHLLSKEERLQFQSYRVPFKRVDEIARLDCHVPLNHPVRIQNIGIHAMKQFMQSSSHRTTYLLWDESRPEGIREIYDFMRHFIQVAVELPEGYGYADFHKFIVQHPQGREAFVQVPARQDGPYAFHLYLHSVWDAKMKIVEELKGAKAEKTVSFLTGELSHWIGECKQHSVWTLTSEQESALHMVFSNHISFVCGGPGRGKTYWTATLIRAWKYLVNDHILVLGPTGRSVNRLRAETGYPLCETAARFLLRCFHSSSNNLGMTEKGDQFYDQSRTLVIVDEVSMFSMEEVAKLFRYVSSCTIVFLGDKDQLPPIEVGDFLSQVLLANQMGASYPVTEFTVCKRTDKLDLVNSFDAVRTGSFQTKCCMNVDFMPEYHYADRDALAKDYAGEYQRVHQRIVDAAVRHYQYLSSQYGDADVLLVCPVRQKYAVCTNVLNQSIQKLMNPEQTQFTWVMDNVRGLEFLEQKGVNIPACKIDGLQVRLYDRVMNMKNHADMEYFVNEDGNPDCGDDCEWRSGIYNGDMGRVLRFYRASSSQSNPTVLVALDDGRFVFVDMKQFEKEWTFGYAVTVHKSQGSEASCVIVAVSDECGNIPGFLHRNLFYTAITRAKEQVILLGDELSFQRMANQEYVPDRSDLARDLV